MAIDTAAKRKSVSGIWTGLAIVGVTMDATPGIEWRQSAGWGYEGIMVEAEVLTPTYVGATDVYGVPRIRTDRYGIPYRATDVYGIPNVRTDRYGA